MSYQMSFAHRASYDAGLPGITVDVTLSLADHSVTLSAKLDTGATNCVFARRHGEQLGLQIETGERVLISTVKGSFLTYRHEVTLSVLEFQFDVRVCFAAEDEFARDVLGRLGFLDRITLGLVDYEGQLYLSRYGE
jgi:hypothetical protein